MSKSRSKGYTYGTPTYFKGDGGSRTIGILDRFGTHKESRNSATTRAAQRRGLHPARAAGGDIFATVLPQCNTLSFPGPRPAKRAEERARSASTWSG